MNTKSKKIKALFFDTHNKTHKKHSYLDTMKCAMVDAFKLQCGEEGKVVTWFPYGEPAEGSQCCRSMSYFIIVRDNVCNWHNIL